ncbi:metal ABC transporter solute-binding protein, Zn/Mn family [Bacillus sp. SD088]|uniref:metal ABC transporter solute-binding protein, Zn/Mn family n=1 Tax=Bacillus sp. SD088 TaxID=2782012 RepID=UPI001A975AAF|nr:zinc ABC transporter substrate-binding protein [Bacillus sp. SD088]MBO0991544.1 zinc ABC transporter substrate-binding protein [Bacillus sp. SD088]
MKRKSIFLILVLLIGIFLSGCQTASSTKSEATEKENKPLTVFTTIFAIEDFTKKIGGEHVQVKSVYPVGADAHTFEPTMKKMMEIADADLFIFNGSGLEPFIDKSKDIFTNENVTLVEASEGIKLLEGHGHDHHDGEDEHTDHEGEHRHDDGDEDEHADHDHHEGEHDHNHDHDPHIWLDPNHAISMAENIKNALIEAMPSAKEDFEENYQTVKQDLENLDDELRTTVEGAEHPEILVSHAAYGYWEHRYGLEQISISGLSPENEPSQKQLQNIIETADEHDINYIVYDQTPLTKIADIVQKETGTTIVTLHNLEYITEDDVKNKEDYFSIMNKNIESLKEILAP